MKPTVDITKLEEVIKRKDSISPDVYKEIRETVRNGKPVKMTFDTMRETLKINIPGKEEE